MIGTGTGIVKRTVKKTGGNRKKEHCNETTCYLSKESNGTRKNPEKRDDTIPAVSPTSRTSSACHHGHRHRRGAYSSWKRDFRGCAVQEVLAHALPTTNQALPENLRKE